MKKWLSEYGCAGFMFLVNLAILGLIVFAVINGNKQKKIKAQAEREQFVKDSIAEATRQQQSQLYYDSIVAVRSTKEYKDSVDEALKKERDEYLKNTMVICLKDDSLFHSSTECEWIQGSKDLRLISLGKALDMGLEECPECEERERVYSGYVCGDYINIDDLPDEDY